MTRDEDEDEETLQRTTRRELEFVGEARVDEGVQSPVLVSCERGRACVSEGVAEVPDDSPHSNADASSPREGRPRLWGFGASGVPPESTSLYGSSRPGALNATPAMVESAK